MPTRIQPLNADVPTLVAAFRALALKWDTALENADVRAANRQYERLVKTEARIDTFSDGPAAIVALMDDAERAVRYHAAKFSYLHRHAPEEAEQVLIALLDVKGHIAAGASMAMMVWKIGPHRPHVH
jgi:hypothetical protein